VGELTQVPARSSDREIVIPPPRYPRCSAVRTGQPIACWDHGTISGCTFVAQAVQLILTSWRVRVATIVIGSLHRSVVGAIPVSTPRRQ
jgi:hypothetical protein